MRAKFKAILFDFDGVVANYGDNHFLRWKKITAPFGISLSKRYFYSLEGLSSDHIVEEISKNHNLSLCDKARFVKVISNQSRSRQLPKIDDVMRLLLEKLRAAGIKTALVTGGSKARVTGVLDHFQLTNFFTTLIFSDSYTNPKPSPEPYLAACRELNCAPEAALVIENALLGVQSAKSAGCPIYALTTTQSAEELYEADRIFASYSQLYEALESEISLPSKVKKPYSNSLSS